MALAGEDDGTPKLIFVVGAQRSGTNWVQQIIASHPDVASVPSESHLFSHGIAPLVERFHHGAAGSPKTGSIYLDRAALRDMLRTLCDRVFRETVATIRPGATWLVERTPLHAHHLDLIGWIYPEAPIVHILRDGRDVARSQLSQPWGPTTMPDAARAWVAAVRDVRASQPGLAHLYEIRYERLLTTPATEVERLFAAAGLRSDDAILARAVAVAAIPVNVDGAMPAVADGKWRIALTQEQLQAFDMVGAEALAANGYEPSFAQKARQEGRFGGRFRKGLAERLGGSVESAPTLPDAGAGLDLIGESGPFLLDHVLQAASEGDLTRLRPWCDESTKVRYSGGPEGPWVAQGWAGLDRLESSLATEAEERVVQVRGDVHPWVSAAVGMLVFASADGAISYRVVIVSSAGGRLGAVSWYRLDADAPH